MFNTAILATLLIAAGSLFLLKALFRIHIPLFTILMGAGLIYGGIIMVTPVRIGAPMKDPNQQNIIASYQNVSINGYEPTPKKNIYNVIMGKLILDLRKIVLVEPQRRIKIHTVLGTTNLFLPSNVPTEINMQCSIGSIDCNGENYSGFQTKTIRLGDATVEPVIIINADAVFGTIKIVQAYTTQK